jgi:tripartite-type tricarboxylate transporter receptor subunit TctC
LTRKRYCLLPCLVLATLIAGRGLAIAGSWPDSTVRIVVPSAPGSSVDVAARLLVDRLAATWHQPVVIDNRPGADGILAAQALLQASDGRTLLFSFPGVVTVVQLLHAQLSYDPANDLVPIASVADDVLVIAVNASIPVGSLDELVHHAAERPGELNWTAAPGAPYLTFAEFAKRGSMIMTHVPYRSPVLALPDLVSNRVQIAVTPVGGALALAQEQKIRMLAVTARERSPAVPDVVTVAEAGHTELTIEAPVGLFGPKTMSPELREQIAASVRALAHDQEIIQKLERLGMIVHSSTPSEYAATLARQRADWAALAQSHGIQPR